MDMMNLIDHLILFFFFIFSFYKKLYTHIYLLILYISQYILILQKEKLEVKTINKKSFFFSLYANTDNNNRIYYWNRIFFFSIIYLQLENNWRKERKTCFNINKTNNHKQSVNKFCKSDEISALIFIVIIIILCKALQPFAFSEATRNCIRAIA